MIRSSALGRKIVVRMALVTLSGMGIGALCAFFLYTWVFRNHPTAVPSPDDWIPQSVDYLVILAACVVAISIAVVAGTHLAGRIVLPLSSLANAARRISEGDLSARAMVGDRSLGETAVLVDDFNVMATRLEALAEGMVVWNALIAHELRTPVTILKGRLQGVRDGVFAMDDATLAGLLKQVDGLTRLIEDLRIVSLADSGHLSLRLEAVDLAQIVGEVRDVAAAGLVAAGFEPEWALATAPVVCDPTRLRQATLALIDNARVHAPPGRLRIATGTGTATAWIVIEDTGPGLPPDFIASAFVPFHRPTSTTGGSGLGLAVVRAIAEAHGGRALYRPGEAGGSVFEIEIPLPQTGTGPDLAVSHTD
ncbi:MAG: ATP-binding protein [Brevundimonas sp.]